MVESMAATVGLALQSAQCDAADAPAFVLEASNSGIERWRLGSVGGSAAAQHRNQEAAVFRVGKRLRAPAAHQGQHRAIARHHGAVDLPDALAAGMARQLLQHGAAEADVLPVVGDRNREVGAAGFGDHVACIGD